jgi:hypothetical protein
MAVNQARGIARRIPLTVGGLASAGWFISPE